MKRPVYPAFFYCQFSAPLQQPWLLVQIFLWFDRQRLADAIRPHADAVDGVSRLHRAPVVGDNDELDFLAHLAQGVTKAVDVGLVEHGVYLIEDTERGGGNFEQGENERGRGQ